jgi:hypothetical protein
MDILFCRYNNSTYVKLFLIIICYFFINLNYFTLHYLRLFMVIINYFWLLKIILPYVIIGNSS